MFEQKVSFEVATKEVHEWLNYRRIQGKKKEENESQIETLIDAVMCGHLVIDQETKVITHRLIWPIEGEISVTELQYQPRVNQEVISNRVKQLKSQDPFGIINAVIAAITGKPIALIGKMDSATDMPLAQAIAVFFI